MAVPLPRSSPLTRPPIPPPKFVTPCCIHPYAITIIILVRLQQFLLRTRPIHVFDLILLFFSVVEVPTLVKHVLQIFYFNIPVDPVLSAISPSKVWSSWVQNIISSCTRDIDRSSHAGYRFILVLTSLAFTRTVQSERRAQPAPIRTRKLSSRLSGQIWILSTQTLSTSEHKHHLGCISLIHFPAPFICTWVLCSSEFGGSIYGWHILTREPKNPTRQSN